MSAEDALEVKADKGYKYENKNSVRSGLHMGGGSLKEGHFQILNRCPLKTP